MDVFYEARRIPAHSCLMMNSASEAVAYPRRDLALGHCVECGFISNVLYDASVREYCDRYEDQQSFSPRFCDFQTRLIRRLVDHFGIRGKHVLEIGCGKGDFLIELCRAGDNHGVGIDPTCIPDRVAAHTADGVRFIADYYDERFADLPCDVICCRHTLEHIHLTRGFMQTVRRAVRDRTDMLVFFEVPDVRRVLQEQAFWDVYYEHCSYFSLGSLARLFRITGFDVIHLSADFGGQYLLLIARPARGVTSCRLPEEDDLYTLAREVDTFRTHAQRRVDSWRSFLQDARRSGKRIAIWGSGSKCVAFLSTIAMGDAIDAIVDINPYRQGRFLAGLNHRVEAPEHLQQLWPDLVLVMNPVYCREIGEHLQRLGLKSQVVPV